MSPLVTQIQRTNHLTTLSQTEAIEEKMFYLKTCNKDRCTKRELEHMISFCLFEWTVAAPPELTNSLKSAHPKAEITRHRRLTGQDYVSELTSQYGK